MSSKGCWRKVLYFFLKVQFAIVNLLRIVKKDIFAASQIINIENIILKLNNYKAVTENMQVLPPPASG
jgi:hypothetical protein